METATVYELIGYVASALIVISLLMASVLKLRVINLVGAIVFTAYGLLIDSLPVVLANGAIVLIDIYHLVRMLRARAEHAYFEVVEVPTGSPLLRRFVEFHEEDIRRFQPDFPGLLDEQLAWMVLRDAVPVGVVLARRVGSADQTGGRTDHTSGRADQTGRRSDAAGGPTDHAGDTVVLDVDYVTPAHRDLRAGTALYGDASPFERHGIDTVESTALTDEHRRYLQRMGFSSHGDRWQRTMHDHGRSRESPIEP
jgi:hypothetical protein